MKDNFGLKSSYVIPLGGSMLMGIKRYFRKQLSKFEYDNLNKEVIDIIYINF